MKEPSRFLPFLPDSSSFFLIFPEVFPLFPDFLQTFRCQGWHSAPLDPQWLRHCNNNIDCALMGYAILSHLSCEAHHLTCWYKYTFH